MDVHPTYNNRRGGTTLYFALHLAIHKCRLLAQMRSVLSSVIGSLPFARALGAGGSRSYLHI